MRGGPRSAPPDRPLWRHSLRARLVAVSLVVLVVSIGLADVAAYVALRKHLRERTEETLRVAERRIESTPEGRRVSLGPNALDSLVPSDLAALLVGPAGEVVVASAPSGAVVPDALRGPLDIEALPDGRIVETDDGEHLLLRVDVAGEATARVGGRDVAVSAVVLGADLGPSSATSAALLRTEVVVGVLILATWAGGAWAAIGFALRPLQAMAHAARRMAAGHPGPLPYAEPRSETGVLGAALNEALEARAHAEASARSFLADASHELRTPLAAVQAWTELYRVGGLEGRGAVAEAMTSIEGDAARMSGVVEQMLELARVESVGIGQAQAVDLADLAGAVVSAVRPLAADRIAITGGRGRAWVSGNEGQLYSLLQNLVTNALRHAGPEARVEVGVAREDGQVVLAVADDGPGMTPHELARACDRFWRSDRARSQPTGSGLGLALVSEIARQHGGTLELASREPRGLVVTVRLPAAAPPGC